MKRKPLPIYLTEDDRKGLDKIRAMLGEKTLSSTVQSMIRFMVNLDITKS